MKCMRIGQVDLPLDLIESRRAGRLAVFAGAGVSKPSPSNLPGFEALVTQIAEGSLPKDGEPSDQFLGRLAEDGVPIHERATRILDRADSRPSDLHHLLVELFPHPKDIRIVTTNFDRHFESALSDRWPDTAPAVFAAPALPIGSRFSGLTYLHGRLGRDPGDLVLTDSDFGRAYLTEGWARRFLRDLFAAYDVLFVGYSHQDVVLSYLARGLPSRGDRVRFALTRIGQPERWPSLRITPIEYDPANHHIALCDALRGWLDLEGQGALRHERKIQQLVERSPEALAEQNEDYLLFCLRDPKLAQFFYRHAHDAGWLTWADERSVLALILNHPDEEDSRVDVAAQWFARDPLSARGEVAREIAHKARSLHWRLWNEIAHSVWRALDSEDLTRKAAEHAAQWLTVLERHGDAGLGNDVIDYWLQHLSAEEHTFLAIHLWEYLTRPIAIGERGLHFSEDDRPGWKLRPAVKIRGDRSWLSQGWSTLFLPNLHVFARHLAPLIVGHLHQAHLLLRSQGAASDRWDALSYGRIAIEPIGQNEHGAYEAFDVLIDAARDILDWLIREEPATARCYIETGFSADSPLVRRLSIYGLARHPQVSAGRKIMTVVEQSWLKQRPLRHETYLLLRESYEASGRSARRRLIRSAERAFLEEESATQDAAENARAATQEFFNLLVWLEKSDPSCPLVAAALKRIRRKYPDFEVRDYPDFDHWSSGVHTIQTVSPVALADLLQLEGQEWLAEFDQVIAAKRDPLAFEDPISGFLGETEKAAAQDFAWGLRLAQYFCVKALWDHAAWHYLLRSWAGQPLAEAEWNQLLSLLRKHEELLRHATDIADMLQRRIENRDLPATEEIVARGFELAEALWPMLGPEAGEKAEEIADWVQFGLNKAGGKLGLLAVYALSRVRSIHGEEWKGIPPRFRPLLERMAAASGESSPLARVMLASQLHFFFGIDAEWTRANLLPLFNWSRDLRAAEQAWHGFLTWGRPTRELLPELMPYVTQTFDHLAALKNERRRFSEQLAGIAYRASQDPLEAGWIREYLRKATPEDRKAWASTIGSILRELDSQERRALWDSWLRRYLEFRLESGIPIEDGEWSATIRWTFNLAEVLPVIVELIARRPAPAHAAGGVIYYELRKQEEFLRRPQAFADLVLYLLSREQRLYHHCNYVGEIVEKLLATEAPRTKLRTIVERMAELGCANAQALAAQIDAHGD